MWIFGFKGASTSKATGARSEMMMDDYDGQMIFGDLVGLKLPDIRLTGEENPEKTSPRKLVPTGDRTRARCVTSAHATTCSTAVDGITIKLNTLCVCVCVCVCVPMPTHCTITCFGFHARRIDGVECGLFSIHAPFGQTTLRVGRVSV